MSNMLLLTERDVQHLLSLDECIRAVEHAFRLHGEGKVSPPSVVSIHGTDGSFHIKAGVLKSRRAYFAAKVNGNFPNNHERFGLPTIQGLIVLCDSDNGTPLAVMDSREITSLRTGAATAVASKYLARHDSRVVTICGCGKQGRAQLKAIACLYELRTVFAYDIKDELAGSFARTMANELNLTINTVADLSSAVQQSDICVTSTPSHSALLTQSDVRPGAFIAAIGADNPDKHEIHPNLMAKSKVVCDILEQCAVMGDLHHALESGLMKRSDVHAELGEVVAGTKPGRESNDEIVVFDSTGMALQDVASAAVVYERAVEGGAGVMFDLAA
jgi:alanine dehydrogenase